MKLYGENELFSYIGKNEIMVFVDKKMKLENAIMNYNQNPEI